MMASPRNHWPVGVFAYWLGEPFWDTGLATEAGRALLD